ncbi:hypothetical protein N7493_010481 [Penicillium malachiteum]|uniref:F-box domain-containing protein n=1 Tax=Penicillium malachiteum TaxID=1324776 RepID=A0AAD6MRI4_9EURO|nr:hypothetical protein N7493_010481 [Penicillium malachiteum]
MCFTMPPDAIIRTTAYHRRDFCLSIIWYPSWEHVNIISSIAKPFPRTPSVGIGTLDCLPLELLLDTLCRLDIHSLLRFRQMNLRSRQTVDSLSQYQKIASHGLNLICALFRTRRAADIPLLDFYDTLCTKPCAFCGEFAGFISLLTWKRCCFACLQKAPETQVRTLASMRKQLHLTKPELAQLVSFKSLPGIYTMNETIIKSRTTIVSLHEVMVASKRQSPTQPQASQVIIVDRNQKFNFMRSCALPYYDKATGNVERGISCAGCQLAIEKKIFTTGTTTLQFDARDKVYTQDGFLDHFRWYEQAQVLWKSSAEGTKKPTELPLFALMEGHFKSRE